VAELESGEGEAPSVATGAPEWKDAGEGGWCLAKDIGLLVPSGHRILRLVSGQSHLWELLCCVRGHVKQLSVSVSSLLPPVH
jgi:hypothetical protein